MICPKCMQDNVTLVNNSHYVCNNPKCLNNGVKTQFKHVVDNKLHFPYNQIFVDHNINDFYRKPYLVLEAVSTSSNIMA